MSSADIKSNLFSVGFNKCRKPTAKMISFAEIISGSVREEIPKEAYEDFFLMHKFINDNIDEFNEKLVLADILWEQYAWGTD